MQYARVHGYSVQRPLLLLCPWLRHMCQYEGPNDVAHAENYQHNIGSIRDDKQNARGRQSPMLLGWPM